MSLCCKACVVAALVAVSSLAHAAPPTVTPSPGYDARLQEQRAAASSVPPPATVTSPVKPHHHKKTRAQ